MGILKKENAELRSDTLVVDIMGGNEINLREIGTTDVQPNALEGFEPEDPLGDVIPGGILIMDANGNLKVENVTNDYGRYRASLFLPDELEEFGKSKSSRKDEAEEDTRGGAGKGGK
jgi:hypothetical protein